MSTPVISEEQASPRSAADKIQWMALAWLGLVLILVYLPALTVLVRQWIEDEDMGYGFFVPLVAGYLIWEKRGELARMEWTSNGWGLVLMAWGAVQMMIGHLGVELFLSRTAFVISLVGCVLYVCGWPIVKAISFPLGLLFLMVPIPAIIYNQITFPLQLFASSVAEHVLFFAGIPVVREGNILELPSQRLSVVEACSGIRSLLALSFLSLTYAAVFDPKRWMRAVLLVVTVPIAILSNATRVTLTGLLSEVNPELARGLFHTMEGTVMYLISLVMLFFAHRGINAMWRKFASK